MHGFLNMFGMHYVNFSWEILRECKGGSGKQQQLSMAAHAAELPPPHLEDVPDQQQQSSSSMAAHFEELPPPGMSEVPERERITTMKQWLLQRNIEFDDSSEGVKAAWKRAQNQCRKAAQRLRSDVAQVAAENRHHKAAQRVRSSVARRTSIMQCSMGRKRGRLGEQRRGSLPLLESN